MFRGAQAAYGRCSRTSGSDNSEDEAEGEDAEEAAVKIQSLWRGRQEKRMKPWGYYTHSLGLTFAKVHSNDQAISSRRRLYFLLEEPTSGPLAEALSVCIVVTIIVSIVGFVLETVPEMHQYSPQAWLILEVVCTAVFSAEYGCRLAVCEEAGLTPIQFMLAPLNMFDLVAVLPFYVEVALKAVGVYETPALRALRVVRLIRVLRMFKLGRYASGMRLMGQALKNSSQAISVLIFLLCMGVTVFSSALFTVERLYCPDRQEMSKEEVIVYEKECADGYNRGVSPTHGLCCSEDSTPLDFESIVSAAWWSTVTMTSVGYGEVYPKTGLGKGVGVVAMLVGMVLIALPVAIVGQKFQDVYESNDLEEAKLRAAARMHVSGEVWSLVPASDVCPRLRHLKVKDPELSCAVAELAASLEEVWEQREQLSRERKYELDKQDLIREQVDYLLGGMQAFLPQPPPD